MQIEALREMQREAIAREAALLAHFDTGVQVRYG